MDTSTPNGHIYFRSFGQDMFYTAFDSLNDLARQFTSIWPFSFSTFGEQNIDYEHSSIFLDGKIVIPTIAGLPLSLAVNGTSIVKVSSYVLTCFGTKITYSLYTNIRLKGWPNCCISVIIVTKLTKHAMDLPKGYKIMWRNEAVTSRQPTNTLPWST